MLKRKIYDELVAWKSSSNGTTAMMIDGARRVGKSYIAEAFAKAEYKSYILIDLDELPQTYWIYSPTIALILIFSSQNSQPSMQRLFTEGNR